MEEAIKTGSEDMLAIRNNLALAKVRNAYTKW
jgi:hypothetical protein